MGTKAKRLNFAQSFLNHYLFGLKSEYQYIILFNRFLSLHLKYY